ncbi:hypothetical protein IFR05_013193 [Cadophora sp. M221]|nr:hypothetical protein IFR05_013193 [Cadophora sp. M221]
MRSQYAAVLQALALSQLFLQCFARSYYVHPTGSDSNAGTSTAPFLTLTQAQKAVRGAVVKQFEDISVYIADGVYLLSAPLNFTNADSGTNGFTVYWKASGSNALISGGTKLSGWTLNSTTGIYSTSVAVGTVSRNLFVGGKAAQYARTQLSRSDFTFNNSTLSWTSTGNDWLTSIPGIEGAEIRAINSFTDRYSPVASAGKQALIMEQPAWKNNLIGWDTIPSPFAEEGFYIQNALSLLTIGGQYFLDSTAGKVYYKPLTGENMATIDTYLGRLEVLFSIGGTYDSPARNIAFEGLQFAHTTWNRPTRNYGYVDQQTGGYWGDNVTYPIFEASRPFWYQMPSGIQISAAKNISFTGGTFSQFGAGGIGIGNDPNAHLTGVGLGANNISITDSYFTQIMGNAVTGGGIQANAHHPSDTRMINSQIQITGNIFNNNSALYSSAVPILITYIQYSTIANNDLFHMPYSGICVGYGWGSNDAGGSTTYLNRGLYNYQPLYTTPTTSLNNKISGNLIHSYGLSHTDLAGIYTLSKSPGTQISRNFVYDSTWFSLYTDEGSNSLIVTDNVLFSSSTWFHPNQGTGMNTGNNTLIDNFGFVGSDAVGFPDGTGSFGNTFIRNYVLFGGLTYTSSAGLRTVYRAGVFPGRRGTRPVTNAAHDDYSLGVYFQNSTTAYVVANLSNFDDLPFTAVTFTPTVSAPYTLTAVSVPSTIPANSFSLASWKVTGNSCLPPTVSLKVQYTNSRTAATSTVSQIATSAGLLALDNNFNFSSTWAGSAFGRTCTTYGITASGRDAYKPNDDWVALYKTAAISTSGSITAYAQSIDPTNPWTKSGLVVRNSLASGTTSTGYATLFLTPSNGVSFQYDSNGDGILDLYTTVTGVTAPAYLRLTVSSSAVLAAYSKDSIIWVSVSSSISLYGRASTLDAGVIQSSHAGFLNSTSIFANITIG